MSVFPPRLRSWLCCGLLSKGRQGQARTHTGLRYSLVEQKEDSDSFLSRASPWNSSLSSHPTPVLWRKTPRALLCSLLCAELLAALCAKLAPAEISLWGPGALESCRPSGVSFSQQLSQLYI